MDIQEAGSFAYQIERFDIGDSQITLTYMAPEDVANGVLEFHTLVFDPTRPELQPLVDDLVYRMCGLVDEVRTTKQAPLERKPGRRDD